MPELPEVQTTTNGLNTHVVGKTITDVWTNYNSPYYKGKNNVKDPAYFKFFKKHVVGKKIVKAHRRAKQIFITLECGHIISVHMKMTGHFLFGKWQWNKKQKKWQPKEGFWNKTWAQNKEEAKSMLPMSDPYNDFIHIMFDLKNDEQLAFSDMRKFATVCLLKGDEDYVHATEHLGPEPLEKGMTFNKFFAKLKMKPKVKVKTALLDQVLVAGFGNIYTDEVLWQVGIHPESLVGSIPEIKWKAIFTEGKKILNKALKHGGDSMGDYRQITGRGGNFQNMHKVYQQDKKGCVKKGCSGTIEKKEVGTRMARFCPKHQKLYK